MALFDELPFDAFEEVDDGLVTAVSEDRWTLSDLELFDSLREQIPFTYTIEREEPQNWNAIWESTFTEIIIDRFCVIRAPFHQPTTDCQYDIVIDPRMAFGTGHHETTRLMIRSMQQMELTGKSILDFGSGSGVLAILAGKMGGKTVYAIENDPQAMVNLEENILYNIQEHIIADCKDHLRDFSSEFLDLGLANITRNVLLEHASDLARIIRKGGYLIVSGFLKKDQETVVGAFEEQELSSVSYLEENDWIAHTFVK